MPKYPTMRTRVKCPDGFTVSVQAHRAAYCAPKVDGLRLREYTHVEVGFPSQRPEPWGEWAMYTDEPSDPTRAIYTWVPLPMVVALVESHGGTLEVDR